MLIDYGWTPARQQDFEQNYAPRGFEPARVAEQHRGGYRLIAQNGDVTAQASGRLFHEAAQGDLPAVGDWVAIEGAIIHHVLPRTSAFQRKATTGHVQTICANLDIALLALALNGDFNLRRLERYLAVARDGGAQPLIVLTKADLCENLPERRAEVDAIAGGAPVFPISSLTGEGLPALAALLAPGQTAALLGSSGVGKSTLVNALSGEERMETRATSNDRHGRHTTTHRELILLPSGALLLDSPGMRELGVFAASEGVSTTFEDVEEIAASCRFSDCRHRKEPGCAVNAALESGALDPSRWANYQKLQRELAFEERKENVQARAAHRDVWMQRVKAHRAHKKLRDRQDEE